MRKIHPQLSVLDIEQYVKRIEDSIAKDKSSLHLTFKPSRQSMEALERPASEQASQASIIDRLWRDLPTRRALIVACGLQFFQQATGFNSLMY